MKQSRFKAAGQRARAACSAFIAAGMALLFSATTFAQAPAAAGGAVPPQPPDYLTGLVGRIALYPDDLVAIILPAATSPLQIVQADRYLDKRKSDPKLPIDDKWDDPVKSLLNYPDVVKMMSNDLDWTSELGEAVVSDQAAVLEAVQVFRRQAKAAGNLKSDTKQVVKQEKEVIIIEPADPQVIYVPQYNPSTVVVYSSVPVYGYYPTPYPSYYYPYAPGAAMAAGVIWGAAIGAAWSGNRYGWGGGNDININRNTNVNVGSGNTVNRGGNTVNQGGGRQQAGGSGSQWKSNKQPGQVSSSVGKTPQTSRPGDPRGGSAGSGGARASSQPAGGAGAGGARASTQPAGGAGASRGGGSSSFGGYDSGRQTQMDSSRGSSSRSSASASRSPSGGGARPTTSSASRGGGGGAARGGGGRGGRR
jgi:hypothetical protein